MTNTKKQNRIDLLKFKIHNKYQRKKKEIQQTIKEYAITWKLFFPQKDV